MSAGWFKKDTDDSFDIYCFGERNFGKRKLWNYSTRKLADSWASSLSSSGFEFDLSAAIIRKGGWKWDVRANFAINANKVVNVAERDIPGSTIGESVVTNASIAGSPVYSLYGMKNDGTLGIIGNPVPKYYGGLTTALSYKAFSLELVFDGAAGFDILDFRSMTKGQVEPYAVMQKYVHEGDYLRLSRLSLGYQFGKIGVCLSGTNLFTLTRYAGLNPDVNSFGFSPASQGIDCACYPTVRTVLLGLNFKF